MDNKRKHGDIVTFIPHTLTLNHNLNGEEESEDSATCKLTTSLSFANNKWENFANNILIVNLLVSRRRDIYERLLFLQTLPPPRTWPFGSDWGSVSASHQLTPPTPLKKLRATRQTFVFVQWFRWTCHSVGLTNGPWNTKPRDDLDIGKGGVEVEEVDDWTKRRFIGVTPQAHRGTICSQRQWKGLF